MIMYRFRKKHLLFFLLIIFGFSTKSIAQINYDNVTFECTIGGKTETHKKTPSGIYFQKRNLKSTSLS